MKALVTKRKTKEKIKLKEISLIDINYSSRIRVKNLFPNTKYILFKNCSISFQVMSYTFMIVSFKMFREFLLSFFLSLNVKKMYFVIWFCTMKCQIICT